LYEKINDDKYFDMEERCMGSFDRGGNKKIEVCTERGRGTALQRTVLF
jgi:hypothetical protein